MQTPLPRASIPIAVTKRRCWPMDGKPRRDSTSTSSGSEGLLTTVCEWRRNDRVVQVRIPAVHRQYPFSTLFDWGTAGAEALADDADVAVVVDVLSFTTTVTVALEAGATVLPYPWRDDSAAAFADRHGAVLAVGRSQAGSGRVSLSPASMRAHAPSRGAVVLPSPNGSTIAHRLASGTTTCVAACLRNAGPVAEWLDGRFPHPARVAVVAAGERWPDDSLRPAVEDLWGAGAVLSALAARGRPGFSPRQRAARATYERDRARTWRRHCTTCAGGQELERDRLRCRRRRGCRARGQLGGAGAARRRVRQGSRLAARLRAMTFSIVARSADGESWGVAVASKFLAVGSAVPAAVAGVGAIATQADANVAYKGLALAHLDEGATASVALQRLLEEDDGPRPPPGRHRRRRRRRRDATPGTPASTGPAASPATATRSRATSWPARRSWSPRWRPPGRPATPTSRSPAGCSPRWPPATTPAATGAAGSRRRCSSSARAPGTAASTTSRSTCGSTTTPTPVTELARLLDLNDLYLTASTEDEKVPVTAGAAQPSSSDARHARGHDDFHAWVGTENYEMRVDPGREPAWIDREGPRDRPRRDGDVDERPRHRRRHHRRHRARRHRATGGSRPRATRSSASTSRSPAGSSTRPRRSGRPRSRPPARCWRQVRRRRAPGASASPTSARRSCCGTARRSARRGARSSGRTGVPPTICEPPPRRGPRGAGHRADRPAARPVLLRHQADLARRARAAHLGARRVRPVRRRHRRLLPRSPG